MLRYFCSAALVLAITSFCFGAERKPSVSSSIGSSLAAGVAQEGVCAISKATTKVGGKKAVPCVKRVVKR